MIKKQINDDACDGDVEPHRKRPARNPPVPYKVAAGGAIQRDANEGHNKRRQNRVREQDDEVNGAHESGAGKARRAVKIMIR